MPDTGGVWMVCEHPETGDMKMFRGNFEAGGENTDFTAHMHLQFAIAAEPQYAKYAGGVIGAGGFDEFDLIAKVGHGKNSLYNVDEFRDYMNVEFEYSNIDFSPDNSWQIHNAEAKAERDALKEKYKGTVHNTAPEPIVSWAKQNRKDAIWVTVDGGVPTYLLHEGLRAHARQLRQ